MAELNLSLAHIRAIIFDMDGTMVRNTADHHAAWNDFLERHGKHFTEEEYRHKAHGKNNREILKGIFGDTLDDTTMQAYADEKERLYRERFSHHFAPVEGLLPLIEYFVQSQVRLAVATTSCKANRDFILGGLGITQFFSVITGDEDITHGKPDPEIYIKTVERLGLSPHDCLAFEDTPAGVHAAKAAGIPVIGLTTSHTALDLHEADACVQDFTAFLELARKTL